MRVVLVPEVMVMISAWFVEGVSFESELPGVMVVIHSRDRSETSSTQGLRAMKMNRARTARVSGKMSTTRTAMERESFPIALPPGCH